LKWQLFSLMFFSGVQAEEKHNSEPDDVRLAGGASRCAGTLELKHLGEWRPMFEFGWTLKDAAPIYSVRLLNGSSLCSGRLEVKSDQSWSSVCEADFDKQDAEVVCRELGCGPPSVLQGVLYEEVEAPVWSKEFQCGGHESALLDCRSSGSARNSCSPGKAVGLTCSEPDDVRLVGGANNCEGMMELRHLGEWRPVCAFSWTLKDAAFVCKHLDCGSAVSVDSRHESLKRPAWWIKYDCVHVRSALKDCTASSYHTFILNITCSGKIYVLAVPGSIRSCRGVTSLVSFTTCSTSCAWMTAAFSDTTIFPSLSLRTCCPTLVPVSPRHQLQAERLSICLWLVKVFNMVVLY
uniref:SRCR domain-containing protein n=1 Tax=Haplochromis burtoni TaxID=8153 RepID=A0A3Q2WWH6_HAPBU